MSDAIEYHISPCTRDERALAMQWASEQFDWNHGEPDFVVWARVLPAEQMLAVRANKDGALLGMIIAACHPTSRIGFIGEYMMREDLRGRGIGQVLWDQAIAYLRERGCTNIGLSGAQKMWTKYRDRSGFVCIPDHVTHKLTFANVDLSKFEHVFKKLNDKNEYRIDSPVKLTESAWSAVHEYDKRVTNGEDRQKWLRLWLTEHPAGIGRVAVHSATGAIAGFGQIRDGTKHRLRIGPLYADNKLVAAKLLHSLLAAYADISTRRVEIITTSRKPHNARELVEAISGDEIATSVSVPMYTDWLPTVDYERIYSLSDLEINFV